MKSLRHYQRIQAGFTLVELMVALFLGVIATAGMYLTYVNYSTAAEVQSQTLELQQGLRVAMNRMVRETRMAGYNPRNASGIGITVAKDNELTFTMDITGGADTGDDDGNGDGLDNDNDGTIDEDDEKVYGDGDTSDSGENITYSRSADGLSFFRTNNNAVPPETDEQRLLQAGLDNAVGDKPVNFIYLDKDRIVLTPGAGVSLSTADMQKIKYIRITLVFRSTNEESSYTDSFIYSNLQGTGLVGPKNDHRRRQRLTAEVNVRNANT